MRYYVGLAERVKVGPLAFGVKAGKTSLTAQLNEILGDYLSKGRKLEKIHTDLLSELWTCLLKSISFRFSDDTSEKVLDLMLDIEAELQLRGLEPSSKSNLH